MSVLSPPPRSAEGTRRGVTNGLVLANRGVGAALQFVVVVVVARAADARTLGAYLAFSALVRLVGTAVSFGQPWYALRAIPQADEVGDPAGSRRIVRQGARAVSRSFLLVLAVGVPAGLVLASHLGWQGGAWLVAVAALAVGGYAFTDVGVDALKARSRTHWGLFLDFSLTPLSVIAVAIASILLGVTPGIFGLALAHAVGTLLSALASFVLWERDHRRRFPDAIDAGDGALPTARAVRRSTMSFGLTSLLTTAAPSLPQVLLPFVMSLADVGRVGAAIRLTSIPGTLVVGLSSVYAPRFARLAIVDDRRGLTAALRESQIWVTGLYIPFAIVFIVAPQHVALLLGHDFAGTATPLRILGIGQLVNALTGLAPMLLTMCNNEMYVVTATAVSVVAMGGASIAAGAAWGVIGAAFGYASVVSLRNVLIYMRAAVVIRRGTLVSEHAPVGVRSRAATVVSDA